MGVQKDFRSRSTEENRVSGVDPWSDHRACQWPFSKPFEIFPIFEKLAPSLGEDGASIWDVTLLFDRQLRQFFGLSLYSGHCPVIMTAARGLLVGFPYRSVPVAMYGE